MKRIQSSDIAVEVFTGEELLKHKWLPDLMSMVNEAYAVRSADVFPITRRLKWREYLSEEIAPIGLTAVAFNIFKDDKTDATIKGEIVATASAKEWTEISMVRKDYTRGCNRRRNNINEVMVWELTCVAVRCGSEYEKRGLMVRTLNELDEKLGVRHRETSDPTGPERKTRKIRIRAVAEVNGSYWSYRGFTAIEESEYDKGTAESLVPFHEIVMEKELRIYSKDEAKLD